MSERQANGPLGGETLTAMAHARLAQVRDEMARLRQRLPVLEDEEKRLALIVGAQPIPRWAALGSSKAHLALEKVGGATSDGLVSTSAFRAAFLAEGGSDHPSNINSALRRLKQQGLIVRLGYSLYRITSRPAGHDG